LSQNITKLLIVHARRFEYWFVARQLKTGKKLSSFQRVALNFRKNRKITLGQLEILNQGMDCLDVFSKIRWMERTGLWACIYVWASGRKSVRWSFVYFFPIENWKN